MQKKLVTLVCVLCFCLCLTPTLAFAVNEAGNAQTAPDTLEQKAAQEPGDNGNNLKADVSQDVADSIGKSNVSAGAVDVNGTSYNTIAEAFSNVLNGQTVKLLSNVEATSQIVLSDGKSVTLDLNGYTLTGNIDIPHSSFPTPSDVEYFVGVASGSSLTVCDTSSSGAGKIQARALHGGATGSTKVDSAVFEIAGNLKIESGTLELMRDDVRTHYHNNGYLLHSASTCVVEINGGTLIAGDRDNEQDVSKCHPDATISLEGDKTAPSKLIINGGVIGNTDYSYLSTAAGIYTKYTDININAGTFNKSGTGYLLYAYSANIFNITGGTFVSSSNKDMIQAYSYSVPTNLVVSGGNFSHETPDAVSAVLATGKNTSVVIKSGNFCSASNESIVDYSRAKSFLIEDGIFEINSNKWPSQVVIKGGKYTTPVPSSNCDDGLVPTQDLIDGYYGVTAMTSSNAPVVLKDGFSETLFNSVGKALESARNSSNAFETEVVVQRDIVENGSLVAYYAGSFTVNPGISLACDEIKISDSSVTEPRATFVNHGTVTCNRIYSYKGFGYFDNSTNGVMNCGSLNVASTCVNHGTLSLGQNGSTSTTKFAGLENTGIILAPDGYKVAVSVSDISVGAQTLVNGFTYVFNAQSNKWDAKGNISVLKNGKVIAIADILNDAYELAVNESADEIVLGNDIESQALRVRTTLTIDLNGHSIKSGNAAIPSNGVIDVFTGGSLVIKDSTVASNAELLEDGSIKYDAGFVQATFGQPAISVKKGGSFTLASGMIKGNKDKPAIYIGSDSFDSAHPELVGSEGATVTIDNGVVMNDEGYSGAILILGTGSSKNLMDTNPSLTVNGGVVVSKDGIAIAGQGVYNNTKIAINGGLIQSATNYGIYHPQYGLLEVCGGTVSGSTAIGIKGGDVVVLGKPHIRGVGEKFYPTAPSGSGIANTGDALYIEDNYGRTPSVVINGGVFESTNAAAVNKLFAPKDSTTKSAVIAISAGTFTSDPTAYVKNGFTSKKSSSVYMVSLRDADNPEIIVPESCPDDSKSMMSEAAQGTSVNGIPDSVLVPTPEESLAGGGSQVLVKTYLSVEAKEFSETETEKTLKLDITPMAIAVKDVNGNQVSVAEPRPLTSLENVPITVTIAVPVGFAKEGDVVCVYHHKDGIVEPFKHAAIVESNNGILFVSFINTNGFSEFTMVRSVDLNNVVDLINAIGDVAYTSESKAKIDAARAAYDALNADAKALVPADSVAKLTQAEAQYAQLKADAEPQTPVTPDPEAPSTPEAGNDSSDQGTDNGAKDNTDKKPVAPSNTLPKTSDAGFMTIAALFAGMVAVVGVAVATKRLRVSKN